MNFQARNTIFLVFLFFSVFSFTLANIGTIDTSATNQAKVCHNVACDDFGIINFELSSEPYIVIENNNGISGKVWGDELGWIFMNPTGQGVTFMNEETGLLTGYAWSQVSGWIDFSPTGQSVTIDPVSGEFSGYAWTGGAYGGWIKFDCTDASTCVRTTWRKNDGGGSSGSGGDGGGVTVIDDGGGVVTPPPDIPTNVNPPSPPPPPGEPILPDLPPSLPPPDGPGGPGDGGGGGFVSDVITAVQVGFLNLIDKLFYLIKSPVGNLISRIVTILGLLSGVFALFGLGDIGLNLLRLWSFFLYGMGFKKRNRPWGVVYDSITKQPLDPAYVVLNDMEGREIGSSITDLDGRYGFLVSPGTYRIVASKTNYTYPSLKLTGRTSDELYNDLYFGEQIEIKEEGEIIAKNIPLDQIGFDWNEFAKKEQRRMKFYHTRDVLLARFSDFMFFLGFVVSIIVLFVVPKPYNIIIFCLYIVLLFLRRTTIRRNKKGRVVYKVDNTPLSYGVLRVRLATTGQEVARRVLDETGNYYCLVPNGVYNVSIEKKNDDSSYTNIFTSPALEVKEGILKKDFKI